MNKVYILGLFFSNLFASQLLFDIDQNKYQNQTIFKNHSSNILIMNLNSQIYKLKQNSSIGFKCRTDFTLDPTIFSDDQSNYYSRSFDCGKVITLKDEL